MKFILPAMQLQVWTLTANKKACSCLQQAFLYHGFFREVRHLQQERCSAAAAGV